MEPNTIFICSTYYHVLIAIVKTLTQGLRADVILCSYIPDYQKLCQQLVKSGIFVNVSLFIRSKTNQYVCKNKIDRLFNLHKKNASVIERKLKIDLKRYTYVYIFHDDIELGHYLQDIKCKYYLLEDACDFFKIIPKTIFAGQLPPQPSLKYALKKMLRYGYFPLGQSKYAISIEVNDKLDIAIPNKKIVEAPKDKMLAALNKKQISLISEVFAYSLKVNITGSNRAIVLTQPLAAENQVKSEYDQIMIYQNIIDNLVKEGYEVYLKPHPRDNVNYNNIMRCSGIIDKNIPAEVISLRSDFSYKMAVTINSTAIYSMNIAKEKVSLGLEYLSKFNSEGNHDC